MLRALALWSPLLLVLVCLHARAQEISGPPVRPDVFRSPQELREYLKALNEYFAIVGRPRFGRSVHMSKRDAYKYNKFHRPSVADLDLNEDGYITKPEAALYFRVFGKQANDLF